jgi:hypothetical protein
MLFLDAGKQIIGHLLGFFDPFEKPLEMASNVFSLHKKITSLTFRISGTLKVKRDTFNW